MLSSFMEGRSEEYWDVQLYHTHLNLSICAQADFGRVMNITKLQIEGAGKVICRVITYHLLYSITSWWHYIRAQDGAVKV